MATDPSAGIDQWLPDSHALLVGVLGIFVVNVVGATPAVLSGPDSAWFQALAKPAIYPPTWLFGVAWTVMFTLMGVALALVWLSDADGRRLAVGAFAGQMLLNVAWTPAFFALQDLTLALAVIVALWLAILGTVWTFARVDERAAALLVPYLLWVTFAAALNYRFILLN